MKKVFKISICFVFFVNLTLVAQNEHDESTHHRSSEHGKNKLALFTGFTHVSAAFYEHETNEESTGKWVPTIGVDYIRSISKKFLIGAIVDMEFDNYIIELNNEKEEERLNVLVATVIGVYKITDHFGVFIGPGIETEFSKSGKNFFVVKAGLEYEIEITNHWEITPSITYDWKNDYNSFSYGFSIGKWF